MPRESKNMQKVATRTCPQEKVSNTRTHELSIDNVDIYIHMYIYLNIYRYIHTCVSSNTFCAFFQVSGNISNIYPQKQPEIVAVSFQNQKNIMVFVFPTYVDSNASNVKNIVKNENHYNIKIKKLLPGLNHHLLLGLNHHLLLGVKFTPWTKFTL